MSEKQNRECTCHEIDNRGERYLLGVKCNVRSCEYHDQDEHCVADSIAIGPSFAATSGDTICATFKPKK